MRIGDMTATALVKAVRNRELTCERIARETLAIVADTEPAVRAWTHYDPELVLARARELDRAATPGALQGVPIGVKDIIDTCDMPTEYGTPIHAGHRPHIDAAVVALSRRAGGIIFGKTVTTEFANRHPGKTRHPHDPRRTPGGSSSGSAAAVGARMVPLALGTQTTQSTIRPAAFCGCVGYRPTWGEIRCHGVMEAAGSLDTVGLITRSVDDVALWRGVLVGDEAPIAPMAGQGLRIGFARTHAWSHCEPAVQTLLESFVDRLAAAGVHVSGAVLPDDFAQIPDAHRWISSYEFARNRAWEIDRHWNEISETLRNNRIKDGLGCSFEKYQAAQVFAEVSRLRFDDFFRDYDVLVTPATAGEAPIGLDSTGTAAFGTLWTTLHVPCVTLPLFTGPAGLPVGLQLVAPRHEDRRLLAVARWMEREFGAAV